MSFASPSSKDDSPSVGPASAHGLAARMQVVVQVNLPVSSRPRVFVVANEEVGEEHRPIVVQLGNEVADDLPPADGAELLVVLAHPAVILRTKDPAAIVIGPFERADQVGVDVSVGQVGVGAAVGRLILGRNRCPGKHQVAPLQGVTAGGNSDVHTRRLAAGVGVFTVVAVFIGQVEHRVTQFVDDDRPRSGWSA